MIRQMEHEAFDEYMRQIGTKELKGRKRLTCNQRRLIKYDEQIKDAKNDLIIYDNVPQFLKKEPYPQFGNN